jgi:predicted nucleic acid-binding protein
VIVVDSNVLAYLHVGREHHLAAESLLRQDSEWAAPFLWRSEFRNVLSGCVRRGELELAEAVSTHVEAEGMMRESEFAVDSELVLQLAHESACTAYDCEYVALAIRLGVKLVTMDKQVLRAFPDIARALEASDRG